MSILNIFKCLNKFQNVLCIYRNYSSLSERVKILVKFRIFVECGLILLYYAKLLNEIFNDLANTKNASTFIFTFIYFSLLVFNNIVIITFGGHNSNMYTKFVNDIEAIQKLYANDTNYIIFVKKQQKKLYKDIALFIIGISVVTFLYARDFWNELSGTIILITFSFECILEYRFVCETMVFYELIDVVVGLLKYLNQSIAASIKNVTAECDHTENGGVMDQICCKLENWGEISRLLVTACHRLRHCFGAQISLSLFTATSIYIMYLYQGILYAINKELIWMTSLDSLIFTTSMFMAVNIFLLLGGQRVENEADTLNSNLALLNNLLMTRREADECARAVRALSRRLRAAPLRVRLQRALPVRAALLADMFAVVLNNTIVLLQYNHVI